MSPLATPLIMEEWGQKRIIRHNFLAYPMPCDTDFPPLGASHARGE